MAEKKQVSIGETIVTSSSQICDSAATLVLSQTTAPQKDHFYLNNHVKQVMAE